VDGIGRHYLRMDAGGSLHPATHETVEKGMHFIYQDGRTVFKYAVSNMSNVSVEMMQKHNLTPDDIAYLIPHQANMRIISATGHMMGLSEDKVLVNIEKFGNTAGTTIPLVLWQFKDSFKDGDTLIFTAFGAGFTWGSMLYKWGV
jgi:3-oxoacyl-[acyl-carrier-protein] synthase-3